MHVCVCMCLTFPSHSNRETQRARGYDEDSYLSLINSWLCQPIQYIHARRCLAMIAGHRRVIWYFTVVRNHGDIHKNWSPMHDFPLINDAVYLHRFWGCNPIYSPKWEAVVGVVHPTHLPGLCGHSQAIVSLRSHCCHRSSLALPWCSG